MISILWPLVALAGMGFAGWVFGYTRGVRQNAERTATLELGNDMLSSRVQTLEVALLRSKDAPIGHDVAVGILRDATDTDAEAG
jgi:hypothetical protein